MRNEEIIETLRLRHFLIGASNWFRISKFVLRISWAAVMAGCTNNLSNLVFSRSPEVPATIGVSSPAFADGAEIPAKYLTTRDLSPPITWSNVPSGTKAFVLIMEDADGPPPEPFVHWLVYNIPGEATGLPEDVRTEKRLTTAAVGALQGKNSRKKIGYAHPSPPGDHVHHYHFEVYALDEPIADETGYGKAQVVSEMNGHVIAKGEMVGTCR
jgi:Raf kinase inhibitor-like YbhB/YbcL family protein